MKNMKSTKRALLVSVMSLFVCFTMLIGTTYAWFTDSVTSAGNIIKTGTLDVTLEYKAPEHNDWQDASEGPIFNYDNWEPGYVMVREVKVANVGTLALNYILNIVPNKQASELVVNLAEVIEAYIFEEGETYDRTTLVTTSLNYVGTVADLIANANGAINGTLEAPVAPAEENAYTCTIVLKMSESAGNEYQNQSVGGGFAVQLLASQLASETDDLGTNDYDANATKPVAGAGSAKVDGQNAYNIPAVDASNIASNVGYVEVPDDSVADGAENITVTITEDALYQHENITVATDEDAITFNVEVTGIKDKNNNTTDIKVGLYIGENKDPATVKVYHYGELVANTIYTPHDGYVTFNTKYFSPFTVVYNAEKEYEAPEVVVPEGSDKPEKLPVANVTTFTDTENIEWGNYGQWSPTAGLDAELEAAYTFACTETLEQAQLSPFANWYCDFYVKLDKDLGENQIFLGGNYGSFGWIGFHNGEITLAANEEIALLGSVTNNPWTYLDIVSYVGEFVCGVGDVDDALADATFTVMLRLTNPEDESEYYDVATITHTFAKTVYSGEELQDAVNNGNENIILGGDIDLSEGGIVIPGN